MAGAISFSLMRQALSRAQEMDKQIQQQRAQAQTAQALQSRPYAIDERAFDVAREQTPASLPNPFDSFRPSARFDLKPAVSPAEYYKPFYILGSSPPARLVRSESEWQRLWDHAFPTMANVTLPGRQFGPVQEITQDQQRIDGALARIRGQNARYDTALSNLTAQVNRAAQNTAWGIVDPGAETAVANAQKVFDKIDADWYASRREALEMLGEQPAAQIRKLAEAEQGYKAGTAPEVYLALREQLENAYGAELLDSLLEYVRMEENAKRMENARAEAYQRGQKSGWFSLRNVGTVPQKLVGGVVGTAEALGQGLVNAVTGNNRPLDLNTPAQEATARADEFRSGAQEDMSGVGRFLYGTGMSLADSGVAILTGQPWILGTAAANSTMQEVKRNGGSESQALTMGVIAGVTEMLTEKLSIDSLFQLSDAKTVKDMLWNAVKQALPEAAEETVSSVVNLLADDVVMGEKSRYNQLIASGMTDKQAFLELAKEVGLNALGGGLSGFVMGSVKSAVDLAANPNTQTETAEQTETPQTAEPTQAEETEIQGIMKKILEMPRINNTVANMIIQDPEASAEFEKQTGVQLTGTTEQKRQTIKDTVRNMRQQPVETVEAPEQTETTQAEQTAQPEEPAVENSYRSYVVGMFANGVTTSDAQEILSNPDLKAEWESVTGKTLPENYKSAVKMILQTKRDPQKLMQQEQPQYTVRPKPEPNTKRQYALGDLIEDRVTGRTWEVTEALPDGKYAVEALNGKGELMQQTVGRNELRYQFNPIERDDGGGAWYERWGEMFGEDDAATPPVEAGNSSASEATADKYSEVRQNNEALLENWRRREGVHHVPGKVVEMPGDGDNLYRPEGMSDEEYDTLNEAWKNRQKYEPEKPQTAAEWMIPKESFAPSDAIKKLGIQIDGSVVRWQNTEQLVGYEEAAKQSQRALDTAMKRLKPTEEEKYLAQGIADGKITEDGQSWITANRAVVRELVDLYKARDSFNGDRLRARREDIKAANRQIANELWGGVVDKGKPKLRGVLGPFTKIVMNERASERVLKQHFGDQDGQKLWDTYFRPHYRNDAEMVRFTTKMRNRVRQFTDQTGEKRELTVEERSMVQHMIEDQATVDAMNALDPKDRKKVEQAAEAANRGVPFDDAIKAQKLTEDQYLQGLVQAYADYMETVALTEKMDLTILNNAVKEYTLLYEDMYDALNEFLVNHGYQPIGFIKHYAPHFQKRDVQNGLFSALQSLGAEKQSVSSLPADLAGRTADFKPNRQWNPHERHRYGKKTEYDIEYGFAQYLDYFAKTIYRTDDIMRVRQAVDWFRGKYSGDEISAAIADAKEDQYKPLEFKREFLESKDKIKAGQDLTPEQIEEMYEDYVRKLYDSAKPENLSKYSELVTWLDNYANILAGKQSMADRGMEFAGGRESLTWVNAIMSTFARANVGANLSSVLNQSAQLPELKARLGTYVERAIWDMAKGNVRAEAFADKSDFLTERRGTTLLDAEKEMEKAWVRAAFEPMEMADQLLSTIAARGRYLQALDEGMTEAEALREADDFGRRVMGSRMKGIRGQAFESKKIGSRLVHIFQQEASNTFDRLFLSDIPQTVRRIAKEQGKTAAAKYVAVSATRYLLSAFLLNTIAEEIWGGTPAPFDVIGWMVEATGASWGMDDEEWLRKYMDDGWEKLTGNRIFGTSRDDGADEKNVWKGLEEVLRQAGDDIPYWRNIAGIWQLGDQTLPTVGIGEAFDSIENIVKTVWNKAKGEEGYAEMSWGDVGGQVAEDALDVAAQFVTGGRQAKKTLQGIRAMAEGGKVKGWGENEKLQYPVDSDPLDWLSAALFGLGSLNETEHFYASGDKALTASQTKKVRELEQMGVEQEMTYTLIQDMREIDQDLTGTEAGNAKREAINDLPIDDTKKLQVYKVIMMDPDSDNYEKKVGEYQAMLEAKLTWDDITRLEIAYRDINAEDADAGEKARMLERWVDEQNWNTVQKALAAETYGYYWNTRAEAASGEGKYAYMIERLERDVPLNTVLEDLSEEQRALYTEHIKGSGIDPKTYLKAMEYAHSEAAKTEYTTSKVNGSTPVEGKERKDKVKKYLQELRLTNKQKRALWLALGYSEKTSPW